MVFHEKGVGVKMLNQPLVALIVCTCAFTTTSAMARETIGAEIRVGAGIPTDDLGNFSLDTGSVVEATLTHSIISTVGVYAGWGWHQFGSDDLDIEQTGYIVGFQYSPPLPGSDTSLRFRVGATYERIELEGNDGASINDSGHGMGIEIGAAIPIALNAEWAITPGVRYRSLTRDIEIDGSESEVDLSYIAVDVGLYWLF